MYVPDKLYIILFYLNGEFIGYSQMGDIYWIKHPHCAQFFTDKAEAVRRYLYLSNIHKDSKELSLSVNEYKIGDS